MEKLTLTVLGRLARILFSVMPKLLSLGVSSPVRQDTGNCETEVHC